MSISLNSDQGMEHSGNTESLRRQFGESKNHSTANESW